MKKALAHQQGQATVEYAIIAIAFLCVVGALAALLHCIADGTFAECLESSASHNIESIEGLTDVLLY